MKKDIRIVPAHYHYWKNATDDPPKEDPPEIEPVEDPPPRETPEELPPVEDPEPKPLPKEVPPPQEPPTRFPPG